MRTGKSRWLVLAAGMLAIAGCQSGQFAGTSVRPVTPAQPFVFYDETGDPSGDPTPLSELELREIIDWVATRTPDPIWLIRVKPRAGQTERGDIIAYLVPDETTPRIRVGRAYWVPKSKQRTGIESPWKYAQVSMPDHRFDQNLTKPLTTELPFAWPTIRDPNSGNASPMSQEEVVRIADFVREKSSYKDLATQGGRSEDNMIQQIFRSPIYDIGKRGTELEVRFGFMHSVLWGNGLFVTLECTPTGYRIKAWGSWIS
jgi:hypothetical protein